MIMIIIHKDSKNSNKAPQLHFFDIVIYDDLVRFLPKVAVGSLLKCAFLHAKGIKHRFLSRCEHPAGNWRILAIRGLAVSQSLGMAD